MKIAVCLENQEYLRAVEVFVRHHLQYSQIISCFRSGAGDIQPDDILLTDLNSLYAKSGNKSKYLLVDSDICKAHEIFKYQSFDRIVEIIIKDNKIIDISSKREIDIITISSDMGGSGKSSVAKHISNYLNIISEVAYISLFGGNTNPNGRDLSDLILEYKNIKNIGREYFFQTSYCDTEIAGFSKLDDYQNLNFNDLYSSLMGYLKTNGIKYLIVDTSYPYERHTHEFMKRSKVNIIVRDSERISYQSVGGDKYAQDRNIQVLIDMAKASNYVILNNYSKTSGFLNLPRDQIFISKDGEYAVNENCKFYFRIKEIVRDVLNL